MFSSGLPFGMTQGATQGATQMGSQDEAGAKKRQEEKQQVLPVTVRAVEEALAASGGKGGAELQFYGGPAGEPSQLILVAVVEQLSIQTSSMEMTLNDGTGRIKARYYSDASKGDSASGVREGAYVCAVGSIRTAPEVHLGLLGIRRVASADEVSYHTIECAHTALRIRKGDRPTDSQTEAPLLSQTIGVPTPARAPAGAPSVAAPTASTTDITALKAAILDIVRTDGAAAGEAGMSVGAIIAALARGAFAASAEAEVKKALADLADAADLFNTIDDDHFSADL